MRTVSDELLPNEVLLRNHCVALCFKLTVHVHSCGLPTDYICASSHANVLAMSEVDDEKYLSEMENDKENVPKNFVANDENSYEQKISKDGVQSNNDSENAKISKSAKVSELLESRNCGHIVGGTNKNRSDGDPLLLDTHKNTNEKIIVHPEFVKRMEKHQVEGLEFMYKCCFNDLNTKKKYRRQDHGCILAHCMGLGKTLQLIGLLHTAITYPQLGTNKILIICPKSTVLNWVAEMERWLRPIDAGRKFKLFTFPEAPLVFHVDYLVRWVYFNSVRVHFIPLEPFNRKLMYWKNGIIWIRMVMMRAAYFSDTKHSEQLCFTGHWIVSALRLN